MTLKTNIACAFLEGRDSAFTYPNVPGNPEDMLDLHSHSQFGMALGLSGLIQQANTRSLLLQENHVHAAPSPSPQLTAPHNPNRPITRA